MTKTKLPLAAAASGEAKMITAKALLDFTQDRYKSVYEEIWASEGALLIADLFITPVAITLYEPISFHVPGGRYTPDFQHILQTGEIVFVEIKATRFQKNFRDAHSKLRAAAEVYPYYHWILAFAPHRTTPAWSLEQIGGRKLRLEAVDNR